jgi:hypothetical protein
MFPISEVLSQGSGQHSASHSAGQFKFPTAEVPKTEPEYIAKAKSAAPPNVANNATITMPGMTGKVVQKGTNGYTCFIGDDGTPKCDDQNAIEWRNALGAKQPLPDKVGFIYMLAGDTGTSNHDADATDKSHWVETGPHVMVVGGAPVHEMLKQYPNDLTVKDASQPFVMFPGKPNQHLMIPVHLDPVLVTGTTTR